MKRFLIVAMATSLAAPAFVGAADFVVEAASPTTGSYVPAFDATMELKWDNGTRRWSIAWYTGSGSWVGNDFDLSTISGYRVIEKVRFYSSGNWPNNVWDGFRVGIYSFSSVPGSLLWPTSGGGYFFKPSGLQGHVWVEIGIGWACPTSAFVAATEQYLNWPNCDPYTLDTNTTFQRHSWQYYQGSWSPLEVASIPQWRNLMLRAVVNDSMSAVSPGSLGRVKALFK
jgi:hypothetical protein